jgi:adenylosuccinate lyase
VEMVIGPDSTILIDFMLHRLSRILKNLVVYPEHMRENLNKLKGLIYSQQVLMALASRGLERQNAYALVQRNALKVWETGEDFKALLLKDREIREHLSEKDIEEIFSLDYHLKNVDAIFERVFVS